MTDTTKPTRRALAVAMERAGAAMASAIAFELARTESPLCAGGRQQLEHLLREWNLAHGNWQQAGYLSGEGAAATLAASAAPSAHRDLQIVAGCATDDLTDIRAELGLSDDDCIDAILEEIRALKASAAQPAARVIGTDYQTNTSKLNAALPAGSSVYLAAPAQPSAPVVAEDIDDTVQIDLAGLLDAPQLYAQVYIAARVIHEWPNDVALDAAGAAAKDHGNSPCKTVGELESVLREVLRTDGDAPAAPTTGEQG